MFLRAIVVIAAACVATTQAQVACGGSVTVLASGSASFVSPGYPGEYPPRADCTWEITGPVGKSLKFDAKAFKLEDSNCGYDYIEISEKVDDQTVKHGKFCGQNGPSDVRTSGNVATVTFKSDSSVQYNGFEIAVSVAKCPAGANPCKNDDSKCISGSDYCNGKDDCGDNSDEVGCPTGCGTQHDDYRPTISQRFLKSVTKTRLADRIVGGIEAVPHSWPWQVAFLTSSGSQICGGTIISENWIMTAAHCCRARAAVPESFKVRIGSHNLNSGSEDSAQVLELSKVVLHPKYATSPATKFDFCMLKTKTPMKFGPKVNAACLPHSSDEAVGSNCFVTGWGNTNPVRWNFENTLKLVTQAENGMLPKDFISELTRGTSTLQQVNVKISEQSYCNTQYNGVISDDMICAAEPGHDSCQGDSGGPLVCPSSQIPGGWSLVGVVSWGRGCAQAAYPGVYARMTKVLEWVSTTMFA